MIIIISFTCREICFPVVPLFPRKLEDEDLNRLPYLSSLSLCWLSAGSYPVQKGEICDKGLGWVIEGIFCVPVLHRPLGGAPTVYFWFCFLWIHEIFFQG